jgi:adenine-specific DNA methylase
MKPTFIKTKPSLMEAGLPCSSLSAECQRDNNARQRPPQNRLHIWWARRPPTVCRVAVLSALIPHDAEFNDSFLPEWVHEPTAEELNELPGKLAKHRAVFENILGEVRATPITEQHRLLLRALGITGDGYAAYRRMALRDELSADHGQTISLPDALVYRHDPPFGISPSEGLIEQFKDIIKASLRLGTDPVTVLDLMAGGGSIPLEAVRYGAKVHANDLNPVAALLLKATLEYPARFGRRLQRYLERSARAINDKVKHRVGKFFSTEKAADWWPLGKQEAEAKCHTKQVVRVEPGGDAVTRDYLWSRTIACPKCGLNIPLSTNFHIVTEKRKPEASIAAFPQVPPVGQGNECTFRIVGVAEWANCHWPRLGSQPWHPRNTPTYKDGHAECPRCGTVTDESNVKKTAQAKPGGLRCQMYAVCSQVPVKLTYRDGSTAVRHLWRFRPPRKADLDAVHAAEEELAANEARWAGLIPTESVPLGEQTMKPHYWSATIQVTGKVYGA